MQISHQTTRKVVSLFEKHQFKVIGTKKDWIFSNNTFKDEILYQLIHE